MWGYNGYCRLGLGNQQDVLTPKAVAQFTDAMAAVHVIAGPSNSVVLDKQGMYWMAGKWKNTGDGQSLPDRPPGILITGLVLTIDAVLLRFWWSALLHLQIHPEYHLRSFHDMLQPPGCSFGNMMTGVVR